MLDARRDVLPEQPRELKILAGERARLSAAEENTESRSPENDRHREQLAQVRIVEDTPRKRRLRSHPIADGSNGDIALDDGLKMLDEGPALGTSEANPAGAGRVYDHLARTKERDLP